MFNQINLWFTLSIFLSKIILICCLIYWLDEESFIVYESSGESALFNVDALTSDPIRSSSAEFFYNDTGPYDSAICRFFPAAWSFMLSAIFLYSKSVSISLSCNPWVHEVVRIKKKWSKWNSRVTNSLS